MSEKFRISFTDFIPQYGKISIGFKDSEGTDLHVGDIVQNQRGEKSYIGYRYGSFMLKEPFTIHSIMPSKFDSYTKINEMWGVISEYIIIGMTEEPFYDKVKDIEGIEVFTPSR